MAGRRGTGLSEARPACVLIPAAFGGLAADHDMWTADGRTLARKAGK
jgi:hypothetical protein